MDGQRLRWTNEAGASWGLTEDLAAGRLQTDEENPYFGDDRGQAFELLLRRNAQGEPVLQVDAFRFLGEIYRKE